MIKPIKFDSSMTRVELKHALRNRGLELPNGTVVVSPSSLRKLFGINPSNTKRIKLKTAACYYTPVVTEIRGGKYDS